ncbi:hypothetical protein CSKR_203159 [Clonorchis sinensis]|uniref:Uncharacterized protein n=1 Tax=Clonorchis sinensis TaxID=79923 RepID=A0A8T1M8V1_CLOSI|nr:hypothetical protein CSKR_203159 [Clonorchis sinensis]
MLPSTWRPTCYNEKLSVPEVRLSASFNEVKMMCIRSGLKKWQKYYVDLHMQLCPFLIAITEIGAQEAISLDQHHPHLRDRFSYSVLYGDQLPLILFRFCFNPSTLFPIQSLPYW